MASDACGRISSFSDRLSGMPICWNPTVTLLQKKREGLLNSDSPLELEADDNKTQKTDGTKMSDTPTDLLCHKNDGKEEGEEEQHDSEDKQTTGHCDVTSEKQQVVRTLNEKHITSSKENDVHLPDMDLEKETRKKANKNDKSWSPPHASYRLKRYQNQPMKIENYEPGMSSVVLQDPFIDNFYNPPVEKPGEFCKYVECSPEVRYEIHKTNETLSPSLSETCVHNAYRKVQKGGDIPLEGLRCPVPPVKAHTCRHVQKVDAKQVLHSWHSQSSDRHSSHYQNSHSQSTHRQNSHVHDDSTLSWSLSMPETDRARSASASSSCNSAQSRRARDELSTARKRELEIAIAEARRKRLIEEAENNRARRHSDYFQPHAKSPVALNRYDIDDVMLRPVSLPTSPSSSFDPRRLVKARTLYTFKAQTNRELSLNKGDTVYILRQIDKNWFEGQRHGSVGIFPVSYVEVLEICREQSFRDRENLAVAKFDFEAEYPVELSFKKGDVLRLIQVVDSNWYEASLGNRCGLVPKSYMETFNSRLNVPLILPLTTSTSYSDSPQHDSPGTMSSTSSCLSSGLDPPIMLVSESCQSHSHRCPDWNTSQSVLRANSHHLAVDHDVRPRSPKNPHESVKLFRRRSNSLSGTDVVSDLSARHQFAEMPESELCHCRANAAEDILGFEELKFVKSQSSVAPESAGAYFYVPEYRYGAKTHVFSSNVLPYMLCQATFAYTPRDEDDLELSPGDIIYVTEMFDDGWCVGISQRTNTYGTFPGNYVQRLRLHHMEPCTL